MADTVDRKNLPKPPRGKLSPESRDWWYRILSDFDLDDAGLLVLQSSLEALDRMRQAQEALEKHGALTVLDRFDQEKPHPAVAIERESRAALFAGIKHLGIELEPLNDDVGRPPGT